MSFLLETIRLGLKNLRLHLMRSVLTSLGIVLGVAAVIVMVSIGEGNKLAALRQIQDLGATNVIVRSSRPPETASMTEERSFLASYGLTRQDLRRIEFALGGRATVVPLKAVGSEVSRQASRLPSQVFGTTSDLRTVANLDVERGRYLTDEDLTSRSLVAVVGAEVAQKLFRLSDPLSSEIRIDDQVFRVVGVLRPVGLAGGSGSALVGRDLNLDVHVPLTTAETQYGDVTIRRQTGSMSGENVELREVYVAVSSTAEVVGAADQVRRIMEVGHPEMKDVQIVVPWELLEAERRQQLVWNIVLIAIAAISLLVGGIGIMNIMLASVTERTREIGIRRALGATRRHIVAQFLVETGSLTAVGGLVGIVAGVGISVGVGRALPWLLSLPAVREYFQDTSVSVETRVTPWSILLSFVVAATVGLVFGIYPAVVASRQDPIEALRHD